MSFIFKSLARFKRLTLRSSPLPKKGRGILLRLSQYKESRIVCPLSCHTEIEVGRDFPYMHVLCAALSIVPQLAPCTTLRYKTTNGGIESRFSGMRTKEMSPEAPPLFAPRDCAMSFHLTRLNSKSIPFIIQWWLDLRCKGTTIFWIVQ